MTTTTRISDGFVPDVWQSWMEVDTTEKTTLWTSGVMASSSEMAALLTGGGRTMNMPFWKDLGNDEPDIPSDDPSAESTAEALTSGKDVFRRQLAHHSISVADLTPVVTGGDPMQRMRNAFSRYWERHFRRSLVHMLTGIFGDNVTNDSSDMVNDDSNDSSAAVTAAELISAESVIDTAQTMGDAKDALGLIIMHSDVHTRLQKLNLIDYVPDSEGRIAFSRYLQYDVIVDDNVRKLTIGVDTTNRNKYYTYLVGRGACAWAESALPMPAEVERKPSQGNGMGVEILHHRRQYAMHVPGIKWTDSSVAGESPSYADLRNTANWDRVYAERKQIPIAALITNG